MGFGDVIRTQLFEILFRLYYRISVRVFLCVYYSIFIRGTLKPRLKSAKTKASSTKIQLEMLPGLTTRSNSVLNLHISMSACKTSTETAYLHYKSWSLWQNRPQNNYSDCPEKFHYKNRTEISKILRLLNKVRKACNLQAIY